MSTFSRSVILVWLWGRRSYSWITEISPLTIYIFCFFEAWREIRVVVVDGRVQILDDVCIDPLDNVRVSHSLGFIGGGSFRQE